MSDVSQLLETILNLSKYHREHEKFYSQSPLEDAIRLQKASRVFKTLADRWAVVEGPSPKEGNPFMGCEDINDFAVIQEIGVLFMEGEGEPVEVTRQVRDLGTMADDFYATGEWLGNAMQSSWDVAALLVPNPEIASVLGERHRIIANDWLAASMSMLISQLVRRSIDIINTIDFSPGAIRKDITGDKHFARYLYSASELLDRAADLASESATLVHDNERRWRVFRGKVEELAGGNDGQGGSSLGIG